MSRIERQINSSLQEDMLAWGRVNHVPVILHFDPAEQTANEIPQAVTEQAGKTTAEREFDAMIERARNRGQALFDGKNPLKQKYRGGPPWKSLKRKNGYTFRRRPSQIWGYNYALDRKFWRK